MPRKPKNEPPVLAYLDELVEKLRERIPTAIHQHDSAAIHQSRVSTRRLAAAVHVLKPILSKPRRNEFGETLRKLRGRLGPLRDLDVMIEHLAIAKPAVDGQGRGDAAPAAIAWAWLRLNQQRDDQREKSEKKIDPAKVLAKLGVWLALREEIVQSQRAIDSLLAESVHLQLDLFIAHSNGVSGRRTVVTDVALRDPHELRIAGKALRYSLEMAVENGHKLPSGVARSFKKMQDGLGKWHDFVVLAECLMSLSIEESLAHHDAGLQIEVIDLAKRFLSKAARSLVKFSELWNERGDELARIIRQTFPLTQPVDPELFSAPKTDHGLFDSPESPGDPMPEALSPDETSAA